MISSRRANKSDVVITTNDTAKSEISTSNVFASNQNQISEERLTALEKRIGVIESVLRANPKINFDKLASTVTDGL
jgi:hypothetical protein